MGNLIEFIRPNFKKIINMILLVVLVFVLLLPWIISTIGCSFASSEYGLFIVVLIFFLISIPLMIFLFLPGTPIVFLLGLIQLYVCGCLFYWIDKKIKSKIPSIYVFMGLLLTIGFVLLLLFPGSCLHYGNYTDETKRMLSNAVDNPSALQYTPEVAFQPGDVLSAQAITERPGIAKDQVCMGALAFGDESKDSDFEVLKNDTAHKILYHGSGSRTVKIAIVCDISFGDLEEDMNAYGLDDKINLNNCPNTCKKSGICCAVILRRP